MNSHPKNGTEKKINQRLFKRLILYYNVGGSALCAAPAEYSQKQTALHQPELMTVGWLFARRPGPRPAGGRGPSAALPLGMAVTGTGSLTVPTLASRDLYPAVILSCLPPGVKRMIH